MAPTIKFPRSNLTVPLFLACLFFCLGGITDAFINSNSGGSGRARTITTTSLPTPIHQSLPSGSKKVLPPFPLYRSSEHSTAGIILAASNSDDDSLLDASLVVASRRWNKKNPFKIFLLRTASLISKRNGGLRKRLRKQTLILSFVLSVMSYRFGLVAPAPAHAEEISTVVPASSEKVRLDNNDDSLTEKSSSSSNHVGKLSGTTVLVASGAHVFRLSRKQKRQKEEAMANFESWNASWNSTTAPPNGSNNVPVAAATAGAAAMNSTSSGYYMPTLEMYKFVQTDAPTDATTTSWNNNNNNDDNNINDGLVDSSSDVPKDDVMKATVEAMKQAGGESTELFQQQQQKNQEDDGDNTKEIPSPPLDDSTSNEEEIVSSITESAAAIKLELEKAEKEDDSTTTTKKKDRDEQKYPKERMPVKDPVERAKIQAKYAAIESLEDRTFQILLDLGMIEKTGGD